MKEKLFNSYNLEVDKAYIITVKGNKSSESHSDECQRSCETVSMPFQVWDAFDATSGDLIAPDHLKDNRFFDMLKIQDHYMTRGEVACALSHISLWYHCATIDHPIVILEHDAIMVRPFRYFEGFNTIFYLGGTEWAIKNWPMTPIPPLASEGPNYRFICRAHAYAIDPHMARNLLSHVIKFGIVAPLDIMMRADLFNITHNGLYAYDKQYDRHNDTTIKNRPIAGRTTERNDDLQT